MPLRIDARRQDPVAAIQPLLAARGRPDPEVENTAARILEEVRTGGDEALLALTHRLDHHRPGRSGLRIEATEIEAAVGACETETLHALEMAAERIRAFHVRQLPADFRFTDDAGVELGERWTPLPSVGVYVPGGRASYPSTVLMNALPARVAGVNRIAMVVPCPGGRVNPLVLAAAHLAGIDEVYRVGGAQAIAALAYGTATISPVNKIVGPGNAYVTAAKRQVYGIVGIDTIAGPSEILVVSDAHSRPDWIAVDLLSQAEHDPDAQAILVTDDASFADVVEEHVARQLDSLPRKDVAAASWRDHGAVVVLSDLGHAPEVVNRLAPEHVELAIADPDRLASRITSAGALFLGRYTPEAIGDYVAGPSHVLPTSGSARFASGLTVLDFLRRTSLVRCNAASLKVVGPPASVLAEAEGLDAHQLSVDVRLGKH